MEILRDILLFLHLLGMAIIVGGYFATIRRPHVMPGMLHGAYLQLVTGLGLVAIVEMAHTATPMFHAKIGIKVLLAIGVTVAAFIGSRKHKRALATAPTAAASTAATPLTADAGDAAGTAAAPAGKDPSAGMAHLTFVLAVLTVLVAVFL